MKQCSKCKKYLSDDSFCKYKDNLQNYCKKCFSLYYKSPKGKKVKQRTHKRVRKISQRILKDLKINGCAICGYNKCIAALEFHHTNPQDKKFALSFRSMDFADKRLVEELNKCILLCNRCHREIHHKEGD